MRDDFSPLRTLIDGHLAEQQRLQTPAARFAAAPARTAPAAARHRDLIPLTAPGPGERYAFQVDLDACTGCKACVAACHSLNGLDEGEMWRETGLLVNDDDRRPFTQTVTSACHHCAEPACLHGCPVLAYEQDPATGIVRHLDDQCIGCSYCILKCPYDAPKYNRARGIVRKCDMCHGRLSAGEAPACAQACPTEAIRIIAIPADGGETAADDFLPGAPAPDYTRPTTRYMTQRPLAGAVHAADLPELRTQPAHAPLVLMLGLTQAALGLFAAGWALAAPGLARAGWLAAAAGLAASVLHLGRPRQAWRAFLGWRRSWLSREILAFAAWFAAATALVAAGGAAGGPGAAVLCLGAAGVFCSAQVYADTRRRFWRLGPTLGRFFGTSVLLGLAAARLAEPRAPGLAAALAAATLAKLALEARATRPLDGDGFAPERKTALLLAGPLRRIVALRCVCGFLGGVVLPWAGNAGAAWAGAALLAAGELAERTLFFLAVDAPKMPGGPAA